MALRRCSALLLAVALGSFGCKENKPPEPPPKPVVAAEPPPAPKPPEIKEPVAERECAAPIDVVPSQDVEIAGRKATSSGYKLSFTDKDADGKLVLGVLGPVNEDSGANMLNLKK